MQIDFGSEDFYQFLKAVTEHLKRDNLPLIAFAVCKETGHPTLLRKT